jgi:HPt (histidine-containing phosphotransfer) domain-containing protein
MGGSGIITAFKEDNVTLAHLDPAVITALRDIMGEDYPLLVDTYLKDSQERLTRLLQAVDPQAVRDGAHSFKGSSSNMGAALLAQLCCDLEHLPLDAPVPEVSALLEQISTEFIRVREAFSALSLPGDL